MTLGEDRGVVKFSDLPELRVAPCPRCGETPTAIKLLEPQVRNPRMIEPVVVRYEPMEQYRYLLLPCQHGVVGYWVNFNADVRAAWWIAA